MDEALQVEIDRARRNATPLSVILFDLDFFKDLNDRFGHESGDDALRRFARILRANVRSNDVACRYGGEEFRVILPEATEDQAAELAERIRGSLDAGATGAVSGSYLGALSVSAGVASSLELDDTGLQSLTRNADQALYRAKENGRNQVVNASTLATGTH